MAIPLSRVKSLCNDSELALVQSSRRPELNRLTPAQLKQRAERARRLFDKWQKQSRSQSRERQSSGRTGDGATRTETKVQIFRDALDAFEKRLAEAEQAGTPAGTGTKTARRGRSDGHRAGRAESRDTLKKIRQALNTRPASGGVKAPAATAAKAATAPGATTDTGGTKKSSEPSAAGRKKASKRAGLPKSGLPAGLVPHPQRQLAARAAAKQSRIAGSGLKSRVRGHVSARGKRSQAKRDSR